MLPTAEFASKTHGPHLNVAAQAQLAHCVAQLDPIDDGEMKKKTQRFKCYHSKTNAYKEDPHWCSVDRAS